jgi:hypothetical protein
MSVQAKRIPVEPAKQNASTKSWGILFGQIGLRIEQATCAIPVEFNA